MPPRSTLTPTPPSRAAADASLDALRDRHPRMPNDAACAVSAIASGDRVEAWRDIAIRHEAPATADDITDALTVYARLRADLEDDERCLIDMARRRGVAWAEIARRLGLRDGAAAQRRHRQLVDDNAGFFPAHRLQDRER
ncbi:hypothetical protein ACIHFD_49715 [Nonomuraea sp. NPDC051941]|uniref:hypothetical protein n=1 Tax=Nonomuraea sp. NPDC051941 TaxID=3364373 RepID=UPI0037C6BC05